MSNTKYILRAVVFALAGSVLVFLLVGMILADRWQVVTTRSIPATVEVIRAKVTDLRAWPDWSALDFRLGNPTEQEVTGVAGTSGQVLTWRGPMGVAMLEEAGAASERNVHIGWPRGCLPSPSRTATCYGRTPPTADTHRAAKMTWMKACWGGRWWRLARRATSCFTPVNISVRWT